MDDPTEILHRWEHAKSSCEYLQRVLYNLDRQLLDALVPKEIKVDTILYSQPLINRYFLSGQQLCETVHQLQQPEEDGCPFPPIRLFKSGSDWVSLDNRRLWCLKRSNLKAIKYDIHFTVVCLLKDECECIYHGHPSGKAARKTLRTRINAKHKDIDFKDNHCLCETKEGNYPCYMDEGNFVVIQPGFGHDSSSSRESDAHSVTTSEEKSQASQGSTSECTTHLVYNSSEVSDTVRPTAPPELPAFDIANPRLPQENNCCCLIS